MKRKFNLLILIMTVLALFLVACSQKTTNQRDLVPKSDAADKAFNQQIDLTGTNKDKVSKEEQGQRIVMDSVALSQVADVLDMNLAAVPSTKTGKMPKRYADTVQIGMAMNPNMEVVKSVNPTMVYAPDNLKDWTREGFEKNNIPHTFVDVRSVDGLFNFTLELAKKFNKTEKVEKLTNDRKNFFEQYNKKISDKKKPRVLVLMGLPGSYLGATEHSYVGNLVKLSGAENILKNNDEFVQLNLETVLNEQPDFILRTAHAMPDIVMDMFKKEFETNKAWSHFNAVKNNKVIDLNSKIFGMTAQFDYPQGLEDLYTILYQN